MRREVGYARFILKFLCVLAVTIRMKCFLRTSEENVSLCLVRTCDHMESHQTFFLQELILIFLSSRASAIAIPFCPLCSPSSHWASRDFCLLQTLHVLG